MKTKYILLPYCRGAAHQQTHVLSCLLWLNIFKSIILSINTLTNDLSTIKTSTLFAAVQVATKEDLNRMSVCFYKMFSVARSNQTHCICKNKDVHQKRKLNNIKCWVQADIYNIGETKHSMETIYIP